MAQHGQRRRPRIAAVSLLPQRRQRLQGVVGGVQRLEAVEPRQRRRQRAKPIRAQLELAKRCGRKHLVVVLDCSREENARRIQGLDREQMRKPRDPAMFRQDPEDRALIDRDADVLLRLDVSELTAQEAANCIAAWVRKTAQEWDV